MSAPINQLKIYVAARQLEDSVITLVQAMPEDQAYPFGDDLRRAASGAAHYIHQAHNYYSYEMKIEALHQARNEAEKAQRLLEGPAAGNKVARKLVDDYTTLIKQSWGLIKFFKTRQAEKAAQVEVRSTDELVASRV